MKTASPKMTKMTKFQQIKMRVAKMPTYRGQREKDIEVRVCCVKCIVRTKHPNLQTTETSQKRRVFSTNGYQENVKENPKTIFYKSTSVTSR